VPNGKAQKELILKTLAMANVSPVDIGYVEVHGTGTALGDPIEFQALTEVFGGEYKRAQPLYIGSVKSNIGHLEAAAGIAGLIKSVLCLQNKQISPNLHLHKVNPKIRLDRIPATVPQNVVPWEPTGKQRVLGISAFGFSGTNAHVIVSEWPEVPDTASPSSCGERSWHILALSAKDENALSQVIARYGKHFDQTSEEKLEDICFTANTGRSQFPRRVAFIAENREQMKTAIAGYLRGDKGEGVIEGKGRDHTHPKLAFLIQGKMHQALAQCLFETQPIFQKAIRSCDERFRQLADISLLENGPLGERIYDVSTAGLLDDVLTFALHLSLLKMWEAWGVRPNAVLGSHCGELVAACAAGIMDMETAFGFILGHWGVTGKAGGERALSHPLIRIISGSTGRPVEKQEALSQRYWEQVLGRELSRKKGIESLHKLGYKHFLQTGIIDDAGEQEDLFTRFGVQCFPSVTEGDPWRTLTTTLADLYCLGLDIDWSGFEQGYSRRKVLLPTYPFQRKHFWCETTMDRLVSRAKKESKKEKIYENNLLDGRIINTPIKAKLVEYGLSIDAVPDVKDTHGVLHVGYFLEMLYQAVKKCYQTTAFCVQRMDFLTAVVIPENGAVTLSLMLDAKKKGELDCTFFSHQGDASWNKRAQGTILLENTALRPSVDANLRLDIINRCTDQYSGTEFYQQVQERGIFLGESVQWIEQVWSREGEALARLRLPRSLRTSHEYAIGVHPGVFEGCAQLFHAALSRGKDTDMRYMVTRWEDFVCHNQLVDQVLWCHVVLQDSPQIKGQLNGRFQLFDENGTVVAQIHSGVMKGLNKEREDALRNYLEQSEAVKERKSESKIIRDLRGLSQDQWEGCLNAYLQQVFAPILSVEVNDLLLDEALLDMGMDSIVGMEAKRRLEEELGISLPIELLIVGPSIRELTESILPLLAVKPSQTECEVRDTPVPAYKMDIHSWILHRKSNPQARVKLFCFPYGGGGGASLYRSWQAMLPNYVEVCPVQLPGKENRVKEKAFTDIERATEVLKQVLLPELDRPYAFYGHSAGAHLAYRLAYKLWSELENKPVHLFVGAYTSPTIQPNSVMSFIRKKFQEIGYDKIPDPECLSSFTPEKREEIFAILHSELNASTELQSILGTTPELQWLFLPTSLAEMQMVGECNTVDTLLFDVPITAFHGQMDDRVSEPEMAAWQNLTNGPFKLHVLPGGHLFLLENQDQKQLLQLLSCDLEKYKVTA
jgi:acyl transferase domain-containing protein